MPYLVESCPGLGLQPFRLYTTSGRETTARSTSAVSSIPISAQLGRRVAVLRTTTLFVSDGADSAVGATKAPHTLGEN
jgi:hypothetical protein